MLYLRAIKFLYLVIRYANPKDAGFNIIGSQQKHMLVFLSFPECHQLCIYWETRISSSGTSQLFV